MPLTTDFKRELQPGVIVTKFMTELSTFLELEIKSKWETLELYKQILKSNPDDQTATQQVNTNIEELRGLIKSLLDVRKDSEFINPNTTNIIQSIENMCSDCGEVKKKEQVNITQPTNLPDLRKKKKKKFEFNESHEVWEDLLKERTVAFTHSSSFIGNVIYDSDSQDMKITLSGEAYVFCNVPDRVYDAFEGAGSKGSFFNREIRQLFDC